MRQKTDSGGTRIIKHDCSKKNTIGYKQQSKMYGSGKVVANKMKDGCYRCTICSEEVRV